MYRLLPLGSQSGHREDRYTQLRCARKRISLRLIPGAAFAAPSPADCQEELRHMPASDGSGWSGFLSSLKLFRRRFGPERVCGKGFRCCRTHDIWIIQSTSKPKTRPTLRRARGQSEGTAVISISRRPLSVASFADMGFLPRFASLRCCSRCRYNSGLTGSTPRSAVARRVRVCARHDRGRDNARPVP